MATETTQPSLCSLTTQSDCMYLVVPNVGEWVTKTKVILTAGATYYGGKKDDSGSTTIPTKGSRSAGW